MTGDDVIELSSDCEASPYYDSALRSDKCEISDDLRRLDDIPNCPLEDNPSSRSSSVLDHYDKEIETIFDRSNRSESDDALPVSPGGLTGATSHQVSSSDEELNHFEFDVDSGFEYIGESSETQGSLISASQSSVASQSQSNKDELKAERQRKKAEKELAKLEKLKEKENKKRIREEICRKKDAERQEKKLAQFKRNQMKPNECLKYMTVVFDEKLFRTVLCSKAIEVFPHPDVKFIFKEQTIENSITWTRSQLDCGQTDEKWVAVMWQAEEVAKAISEASLVSKFKYISSSVHPGCRIVLLIFAMEHYHRKSQNAHNYKARKVARQASDAVPLQSQPLGDSDDHTSYLSREDIETGLVELQLLAGVCHRHFEDYGEFADILGQFTRAIAEIPYKREREEMDKEMGWYARAANKNCVRANKDMQGLDRLWIEHLTVFNNTNVDAAKAIASLYPTPTALIQAYENCSSQKEKESLLQNVQVKRCGGTSAVIRRLGPELSKKICLTFTETDGSVKLSSKS